MNTVAADHLIALLAMERCLLLNRCCELMISFDAQATAPDDIRFEVIVDPSNLFIIWDNVVRSLAVHHDRLLVYKAFGQAHRVADLLNAAHGGSRKFPGRQ